MKRHLEGLRGETIIARSEVTKDTTIWAKPWSSRINHRQFCHGSYYAINHGTVFFKFT